MTLPPMILQIDAPVPSVRGSLIRVQGLHLEGVTGLSLQPPSGAAVSLPLAEGHPIVETGPRAGEAYFSLTADAAATLGVGSITISARLESAITNSDAYSFTLVTTTSLPITTVDGPNGPAHWNDLFVLHGSGFLGETEGTVNAHFTGTFRVDSTGETRMVDAREPVLPAEAFARDRGVVVLTTALGGIEPGSFDGTMTLESQPLAGASTLSAAIPVSVQFGYPEVFEPVPAEASLEQLVEIRGAGFLGGGPSSSTEITILRLDGTFTPAGGSPNRLTRDLVLEFVDGQTLRAEELTRSEVSDQRLVSMLFGAPRGTFNGTVTPIIAQGTNEIMGVAVPFNFTIRSPQQIVYLRFLPGFYDSLARFGLTASAGEIEYRVQRRMAGIYQAYALDIRLTRPEDFLPNGYAIVEIGGPDPTGSSLFGYDNTPGKDVGNLRLYDQIGGSNAETQSDGQPGYGGVFVDSFLLFSFHPDLRRPRDGPEPDALFDQVFDPVRTRNATLAEVQGVGDATRVGEVQLAIDALASMVGETTAHELGHSLGLAEPRGPRTVFHNAGDTPGCIMDNGGARPFGERTQMQGFDATRFCRDEPGYLAEILPR